MNDIVPHAPPSIVTVSEPTLDDMRETLAAALPMQAAFDGWGPTALAMAADACGIDRGVAALAFPGGAVDMIDAWFASVDRAMVEALPPPMLAAMKIRQRVTALIEARLAIVAPDVEALRRAISILALPTNLLRAARLDWRAADTMWRAAGDTATDFNHYSKRVLLAGVYAATTLVMLGDDSEDFVETRGFLARRIGNVMQIETVKRRFAGNGDNRLSLARFLGRLRYPVA